MADESITVKKMKICNQATGKIETHPIGAAAQDVVYNTSKQSTSFEQGNVQEVLDYISTSKQDKLTAVGASNTPVYINADGVVSSCAFSAPTVSVTGTGNAFTGASAATNGALTFTKGATFLTSHQDIGATTLTKNLGFGTLNTTSTWGTVTSANGYTLRWGAAQPSGGGIVVGEKGGKSYLQLDGTVFVNEGANEVISTANIGSQSVNYANSSNYANSAGYASSAGSAAPSFASGTFYAIGDDCYFGDQNYAGGICIKGGNGPTSIHFSDYYGGDTVTLTLHMSNASGTNGVLSVRSSGGTWITNVDHNAYRNISASAFTVNSSKKVKENIVDMTEDDGSDLLKLRPVHFDYKESVGGEKNQCGLIAEEVYQVLPHMVTVPDGYDWDSEYDESLGINQDIPSLDYSKFVPHLIKLCQLQQDEINSLKERVTALEDK